MRFELNKDKSKLILKESTTFEFKQLKLYLTRFVHNYRFMQRYKLKLWDGKINHFHEGHINFGLWQEIYNCCKEYGFKFDAPKDQFPFDNDVKLEVQLPYCPRR